MSALRFYSGVPDQLKKGNSFAAGYDIRCSEFVTLIKGAAPTVIHTDLFVEVPVGHVGLICERSGLGKKGCAIRGGVIDEDYRGEVCVMMQYNGDEALIDFKKGDRVAQLLIVPVANFPALELASKDQLSSTERAEKGFGSTGIS